MPDTSKFYIDARRPPFHTGFVKAIQSNLKTKVSLNKQTGLLEVYEEATGKLVAVQSSPDEDLISARDSRLVERLLPDGSIVLCEATIDPTVLAKFKYKEYSRYVVDLMCEKIVEGMGITEICQLKGYPSYAEFCRWKRQDPEIQKQIDQARRDRAEGLRDKIVKIADNLSERDGDEIKTKIDTYKYLASVDDKQKFGNQKGEAQVVQPIQIVVNTGIVRE